jgi:glycosyltransferase involved in cell wall biosynthesis
MKVLLVVPMLPRADGGGAIPKLLDAELSGLRELCELTVVTTLGEEPGEAEAAAALKSSGIDAHIVDRRRSPSARRRWRARLRMAARWARGAWPWRTVWFAPPAMQAAIDRLAASQSFDVVAIEDSSMSVFRLPAGVPTVFTEHEALRAPPDRWREVAPAKWPMRVLRGLDWRRWDRFARAAWQRFDLVQVFSDGDRSAIAELSPAVAPRLRVNPFGIVLPAPLDPGLEEPGTMLFVGNFTHPPNRDAAIWLARAIMPEVRRRNPQARLRIVGTAPPAEVRELAGPGIEVIADAPSVDPHLAAAAVVIAPVRTGGGMRMKVLEALARGKAVVTTRRGAEGFLGFDAEPPFVVADEAAEMAAAIVELLADPQRSRDLGRRAREFAERHCSPAAWAARLEAIYEEARAGAGSANADVQSLTADRPGREQ